MPNTIIMIVMLIVTVIGMTATASKLLEGNSQQMIYKAINLIIFSLLVILNFLMVTGLAVIVWG